MFLLCLFLFLVIKNHNINRFIQTPVYDVHSFVLQTAFNFVMNPIQILITRP